jgi:hypothetical protein
MPEDIDLLERLNIAMSSAATDDDRDVNAAGCSISDAFKRIPLRIGVGTQVWQVLAGIDWAWSRHGRY